MPHPRLVAAALLLSIFSSGCGSDLNLKGMRCELDGEQRVCSVTSCTPIGGGLFNSTSGSSSTLGMAGSDDFLLTEIQEDHSILVIVKSGWKELARHRYSERFAASGKRDSFTVTTLEGHDNELVYWGVHRCDFEVPPEYE